MLYTIYYTVRFIVHKAVNCTLLYTNAKVGGRSALIPSFFKYIVAEHYTVQHTLYCRLNCKLYSIIFTVMYTILNTVL